MINKNDDLIEQVKNLTNEPGCYLYFNSKNQLIYIGKAKALKKRVLSYFSGPKDFKTTKLVSEIDHLEFIITKTEKEALILEHNLIKKNKPKYNILLTDDKRYPYIAITNEVNPTYKYLRTLKNLKYKKSYGPFPDGSKAKQILEILEYLYPLHRCQKINQPEPCFYFHINLCSGACFKKIETDYYNKMIYKINRFFKSNTKEVAQKLKTRMSKLADNLQFEEANKIKKIIQVIEWTTEAQTTELTKNINADFISYQVLDNYFFVVILFFREGKLINKNSDHLKINLNDKEEDLINIYLQEIYSKNIKPDKIFLNVNHDLEKLELFFENIYKPKTKNEYAVMEMATKNLDELIENYLIKQKLKNSISPLESLEELRQTLQLTEIPYQIEIFDIANIYQEHITGGCCVFKNGVANRNNFRKYNLDESFTNDYSRMEETTRRHYSKMLKENKPLPDLIIVDGGKPQVTALGNTLNKLSLKIPYIGLAKDERHKTNLLVLSDKSEVILNKNSKMFYLLSKFQETVHQYVITHYRNNKNKDVQKTTLETIRGISQQKANSLYKEFGDIEKMRQANFEALNAIVKNKSTTDNLQKFLKTFK
ncbi:excinuclease ABC subunit UvrC [Spiroplasma endosymbiont of Amphibalanus improvisus]|uniref:excinuclease ABC subunit UvrC n=1 Tax=Spiroplasma endosymbiont of Amphibalanus improvisus TaxID=3066327 RepID=UPI00313B72EC